MPKSGNPIPSTLEQLHRDPSNLSTEQHLQLNDEFGAHNYKPLPVVLEKGRGVWVWDVDGNKYMDCLSAYSACNAGHCHPKIVKAIRQQLGTFDNGARAFLHDKQGPFAAELAELCGKEMTLIMNTGAEAVETAIKAARKYGYDKLGIPSNKAEIVVFENNFHGRTTTIISFSSEEHYRAGFGPYTPGFKIIPYGDIDALEKVITENTCAVLLEPIQGEAGIIIPPEGFLRDVRRLCNKRDVLMMADEIQVGLGRTGAMFACDHEGVVPDVYILGKALGGNLIPVSAVVANKNILEVFDPGSHGSTFGQYPIACAAGRASLKVLKEEHLAERSRELGEYFMGELRKINSRHIKEIRGRGLLIGVELNTKARPFCEALMDEGLLCKETHDMVIRFAPPLIITKKEIDWAIKRIKKILEA